MSSEATQSSYRRGDWRVFVILAVIGIIFWFTRPRDFYGGRSMSGTLTCLSNLGRIGTAFAQYAQDNDSKFPRGIDPEDAYNPDSWSRADAYGGIYFNAVHRAPMLQDLLLPYLKARELWHCPDDIGWDNPKLARLHSNLKHVKPSSWALYGTSYYYWTIHGFSGISTQSIAEPSREMLLFDGEFWHPTKTNRTLNGLCADGHVGNFNEREFNAFRTG